MKDFTQAFSLPSISRPPLSITVCWNPPPKGCLKLNVDAAINKCAGKIGLGVVVRDYTGSLVFAAGIVAPLVVDVTCAEAKALLAGAQMAVDRDLLPLQIESDALNVVNLCKAGDLIRSDLGIIIQDIIDVCCDYDIVSISYVPRNCNMVAHTISKWVIGFNSSTVWSSAFPP
ncbi:hypothetical protein ACOSP7_018448 [Xanthoceras sorbifolium]